MVTPSEIPIPASISEQAQQFLTAMSVDRDDETPTDLSDTEAWLQYVEEKDAFITEHIKAFMPTDLPVEYSEVQVGGVTNYEIRPTAAPEDRDTPIYLNIHGCALILGGGELRRLMGTVGALGRDMITWAVDYRMPPMHAYPAALDDCIAFGAFAPYSKGTDRGYRSEGTSEGTP